MELHAKSRLVMMKGRVAEPKDALQTGRLQGAEWLHTFPQQGRFLSLDIASLSCARWSVHVFRLPFLGTTIIMIPN